MEFLLKFRNRSNPKYEAIQYFYFSRIVKISSIRKKMTNYLNCHRTDARFHYITSTGPHGSQLLAIWEGKSKSNERDHATLRTQNKPLFPLFVQREVDCLFSHSV